MSGTALARPFAARAQQPMPIIGVLSGTHLNQFEVDGVKAGLAAAGFKEGENIKIEYRSAEGRYDRLPALARDLAERRVAVIVTIGGAASAPPAKAATTSIPIVFANGADPVKLGLVTSLNHPGGNVTGASFLVNSLAAKRMELLHQLLPSAGSIGFIVNSKNPSYAAETGEVEAATTAFGQQLVVQETADEAGIDIAFKIFAARKVAAFAVAADAFFLSRHEQIVALAARDGLPGMYPREEYVLAGGLVSYAPHPIEAYRLAGSYVARILKGEKPEDLPVQQAVKVYLSINLKAAKALGIAVPPTLLALANEVIE